MNLWLYKEAAIVLALTVVVHTIQPGAAPARTAPLRDLEFGHINFLHTTDTHGWHAGHLLEPSFSADWGDYISFADRLREKLEAEGRDLIVIDTGDRIEGNGLYDASHPRGKYTFDIFAQQHLDILCIGNHELYKNSSAEDDYLKLVPAYKANYLASNLQIIDPVTGKLVYVAPTHRKFRTKIQGLRIMAMGFIFDFDRNDKNTVITPVEDSVKQSWFVDAISEDDIDLFVIIGHVALRAPEFGYIHSAIRAVKPHVPIQFFGGHFHIRDYRVFDENAHALASGRFMETIGFQSIRFSDTTSPNTSNLTFSRRYIDNNLYSLHHHSSTNISTFSTPSGLRTSNMITHARSALNLDQPFGCAPRTYWMSRVPFPHPDSIFSLIVDEIFPAIVNPDRSDEPRLLLTNTGAIRFDIFEGPFTRDSTYIVSPFTSNLSYIERVPYGVARKILPILNGQPPAVDALRRAAHHHHDPHLSFDFRELMSPEQQSKKSTIQDSNWSEHRFHADYAQGTALLREDEGLIPGYTTLDDLGHGGDDTVHSPIQFYDVPNCVQAMLPAERVPGEGEQVDVVFNQFLAPYILKILNLLPHSVNAYEETFRTEWHRKYAEDDIKNYVPGETFTTLLAKWVGQNWAKNCKHDEGEHVIAQLEL